MDGKKYIPQLTFPRFIAALLIVFFHYGSKTFPSNLGLFKEIISQGSIAVSFFFFLSGMVLSLNYFDDQKLKFKTFLVKRIARIFPVYLLSFIMALMLGMILNNAYPKGLSIILQLLTLHAWSPGMCLDINYPGWSISVEMFFYLLFPLIIMLFRRLTLKTVTLLVISVWLLSGVQHLLFETYLYDPNNSKMGDLILYFPLWHLNTFLFGALTGIFVIKDRFRIFKKSLFPLIFFIVGMVLLVLILVTDNVIKPHIHNGLLAPIFFMITLGLAYDKTFFSKILGRKELVFLGDISYSMYILQFPVYLLFMWIVNLETIDGIYFYIYLISLVILSACSYLFFEKKARMLILKRKKYVFR